MSTWLMPAEPAESPGWPVLALGIAAALLLTACGVAGAPPRPKIALLAPFEGQYREIGYNALYALRLAFADSDADDAQLLAIDDGGSAASAFERMRALNLDRAVKWVIALGPWSTHPQAQAAADRPLILVGNWGHDRVNESSVYLAHQSLVEAESAGDLLMLAQGRDLYDGDLSRLRFASSGSPPDEKFRARFLTLSPASTEPNLLATLVYDAAGLALEAIRNEMPAQSLSYRGVNGEFRFEAGYWRDAPINQYRYESGQVAAAG